MARVVYKQTAGIAHDRRFVKANYQLQPGEIEATADELPSEQALSDPTAWANREAARATRQQKRDQIRAAAEGDNFIDRLRDATPQQIENFVDNNVTDFASAKVFVRKLAVAVAYSLQGGADKQE